MPAVGVPLWPIGPLRIAHSDLDVVVPFASALDAAIDLEQNAVVLESDFRDLDLIAGARRRAQLLADLLPLLGVVFAGGLER